MDDLSKEIVSGIVDSAKYSVPEEPATKTEDEVFMEAGLKRPEADPEAQCPEDLVSAVFGTPDDTDDPDAPDPRDPKELEQEEVIRVYEPGQQTIPVLTEDRNPDLAPVTVRKKSPVMAAQKKKPPVSAKKKKGQGSQCRVAAEVLQPLVGNDVSGTDARPGHDPVVGRVQETLQVTVGDHFLRQGTPGTDDLHS